MKIIVYSVLGFFAFILLLGGKGANSGRWEDLGYSSYSACTNSPEVLLAGAQYKMQAPNLSDSQIKYALCK